MENSPLKDVIQELNQLPKPHPKDDKQEWFLYFNSLAEKTDFVEEYLDSTEFMNWCDGYNSDVKYRVHEYFHKWNQ